MSDLRHPAWVAYKSPAKVVVQSLSNRLQASVSGSLVNGKPFSITLEDFEPRPPHEPGHFILDSQFAVRYGPSLFANLQVTHEGLVDPETLVPRVSAFDAHLLWLCSVSQSSDAGTATRSVRTRIGYQLLDTLELYRDDLLVSFKDEDFKKSSKEIDSISERVRVVPKELVDDLRSILQNLGYSKSEVQIRSDQAVAAVSASTVEINIDNLTKAALSRQR